jgi:hypothetical protein
VSASHVQDAPISIDDLRPFRSQWVAIRDGHVVAHALTLEELNATGSVRDGDTVTYVPVDMQSSYLL